MRTKQEIRNWLDAQVGKSIVAGQGYQGQCVSLIKGLMEFVGVPDPYKARGHAKDAGDTYIREGIGTSGQGWLTVCVNRTWGNGDGHIWVDLKNETNYEQNGTAAPRKVSKGTRAISGAQQFVNFDKWVKADQPALRKATTAELTDIWNGKYGNNPQRRQNLIKAGIDPDDAQARINKGEGKPGAPAPPSNSIIGKTVYLPPTVSSWNFYREQGPYTKGNQIYVLNPKKWGGLSYKIIGNPMKDVVIINSPSLGRGAIYVAASTPAVIK